MSLTDAIVVAVLGVAIVLIVLGARRADRKRDDFRDDNDRGMW